MSSKKKAFLIPDSPAPSREGSHRPNPTYLDKGNVENASPGCIVWLPAKEDIVPGCHADPKLHVNAFDHPAIILSAPAIPNLKSIVRIAIMTSGANRTLHQTKSLSHYSQLLRVRTAAHPYAKVDLTLKKAVGMKRKYSWVSLKVYEVELGTLALYERQLGEYCLTMGSLRKLIEAVEGAKAKASKRKGTKIKVRKSTKALGKALDGRRKHRGGLQGGKIKAVKTKR